MVKEPSHHRASLPDDPRALRASLAFAEAILPGSPAIPAADEGTVARAEGLLEHLSVHAVRAFRLALRTLDRAAVLSKGRAFHKLGRHEQAELLVAWERDPILRTPLQVVSLVFKFVHFDRPRVYGAMGGKLHVVSQLEQPRWLDQIIDADAHDDEDLECDVVVVGTGAGGAVVGKELADAGYAVVFVEEGAHHRRDAFNGSSFDAHTRFYRGAFSMGNATIPIFMGRLVGGSTAINTATCFRPPEWVLDRWSRELGSDDFSPGGMERWFDRVERTLGVQTADRRYVGAIADVFTRGCEALGWQHGPMQRNTTGCEGTGFCDFGCPSDARRSTNLSYIPAALERGAVTITGLRAERVLIAGGRAAGIEGKSASGKTVRVRARATVLAAGAIPTPLFLMRQGICLGSGQVGRNLTLHPSGGLSGVFAERIDGQDRIPQGWGSTEFLRDGILLSAAQPDRNIASLVFALTGDRLMHAMEDLPHTATFGVLVADSRRGGRIWGEVGGTPIVTYNLTPDDVRALHDGMVRVAEMCLAAGATRLHPSLASFPTIDGPDDLARFRRHEVRPQDLMLTSYHPLGTCQMSADPRDGVVDLDHQAHELPGLFLVDGSVVRGPLGVNSQIAIMGIATRAGDRIANRLS